MRGTPIHTESLAGTRPLLFSGIPRYTWNALIHEGKGCYPPSGGDVRKETPLLNGTLLRLEKDKPVEGDVEKGSSPAEREWDKMSLSPKARERRRQ